MTPNSTGVCRRLSGICTDGSPTSGSGLASGRSTCSEGSQDDDSRLSRQSMDVDGDEVSDIEEADPRAGTAAWFWHRRACRVVDLQRPESSQPEGGGPSVLEAVHALLDIKLSSRMPRAAFERCERPRSDPASIACECPWLTTQADCAFHLKSSRGLASKTIL